MYSMLLVVASIIYAVNCQYYFVTAPAQLRFDHEETFTISVFGLHNANVKVWLQHGQKKFSEKTVVVEDEETPVQTTMKVTETDLFDTVVEDTVVEDTVVEDKPRRLTIYSEWKGETQSMEIILSYQTGYLILQTDKPIYTPDQKVNIRMLALDESLKSVKDWQVGMDIVSPSNLTLGRKKFKPNASGFFHHEFRLPPYPELGIWMVRAFYRGQLETVSRALFQVDKYVVPTFGVDIAVDVPYILPESPAILITVTAKYVYGKPVDGKARLTLKLKDKMGISEDILNILPQYLQTGVMEFRIVLRDILKSPLLTNKEFPDGSRLEVVATVLELVTGKEEAARNDKTVFAFHPYNFKFTRSKVNFRPGWEFFAKIDMVYANGDPAPDKKFQVEMIKNGVVENTREAITNNKGQAVCIFATARGANEITFIARIQDGGQESQPFIVSAYVGKNQIQVERSITNGGLMIMRAFTNIQGSGYTGLFFLVVTRGQVVNTIFRNAGNQVSNEITERMQRLISPSARVIVFYVDKGTHEMVADSIKFDVLSTCRGKGLSLNTVHSVKPGSIGHLTVTGSNFTWVGLSVMDKALLLLNNKNVLRKNKMFEELESHDLGCGEGSGRNSGDVFKKTGLTILTNAVVPGHDFVLNNNDCDGRKRKRRDANNCYRADIECCRHGWAYADNVWYEAEADKPELLDPYSKCYGRIKQLVLNKSYGLSTICLNAFLYSCVAELKAYISDITLLTSKSFDVQSTYMMELEHLADNNVQPHIRTDFRESWLFQVEQLDNTGEKKIVLSYPDSITDWRIQAIGITAEEGMCISDPIDVKAFRQFFIQLDLPYKAVRLEHFDVKATIFNYGSPLEKNKTANVYIEGVENICYNSKPGEPSPGTKVELAHNSAHTVRFPMIPLKQGKFSVKVSAIVTNLGIPEVDVIKKELFVVNEGVEEQITIQVCLDPNGQMEDCRNDDRVISNVTMHHTQAELVLKVDLTLPQNSIAGTGSATGYMQSNTMDNVVKTILNGVDSLLQQPVGCGEQTMIYLAPSVYAMMYLTKTKQVTPAIEVMGNQFIRDGVTREVSQYRHPDGSYAAWQYRPPSTWLTAFVAKVLCQAKKVVDDAVDEKEDILLTLGWLRENAMVTDKDTLYFVDNQPVIHREMIGQLKENDPSLTAFVLLSLLECEIRTEGIDETVKGAIKYIEDLNESMLKNNPYILAISTYTLALADNGSKWKFKRLLHSIEKRNGGDTHWGDAGGYPANAQSVETTSYALLALMEFNDFKSSAHIVRWLTSQRDAQGSFRTTQATVIGLQALSIYSIRTYSDDVNLKVSLLANQWASEYDITRENSVVQTIAQNLPVEHADNKLMVRVTGTGTGRMMIDLRYNRIAKDHELCPFDISSVEVIEGVPIDDNLAAMRKCDVCGICDGEPDQLGPYDDYTFDHPIEADPKIENNFGRRKRQANRNIRATRSKACIRFSVSSMSKETFGMSIVQFGLENGVEVVQDDLIKLLNDTTNIDRFEVPSMGNGLIIFYLHKITAEKTNFSFRLKDTFEGEVGSRQPSTIKVYDYYHPEKHCTQFYGIGENRGESVKYECDIHKKQCQCLQSLCIRTVEGKLLKLMRNNQKPVLQLYKYTCNPRKADYAVLVEIEMVNYNIDTEQKVARAKVIASIHNGTEQLSVGDEMNFYWTMTCGYPDWSDVTVGKKYYILGRDGYKFRVEHGEEYRYPLMGTALVIKDDPGEILLKKIMRRYQKIMSVSNGCMA